MILATTADRPAIEAFLHDHLAQTMFPLSNLALHGMAGGHARAMRFWLRWQDGRISDVLSVSEEGMIFPCCPTGPWGDARVVMAGTSARGIIGEAGQVAACRDALGLVDHTAQINATEPHFTLALDDLALPDARGLSLHPLNAAPDKLVLDWRAAFCVETMGYTPDAASERAEADMQAYRDTDTHRVLMAGDAPVAMTGFNAVLPQAVQIGGVYTPPALRGRGYARQAVALHLAEVRAKGVTHAVLSAANAAAARAYTSIGFRRCGDFGIVAYDQPQVIHV